MPFLLNFISKIHHESAFETFARGQRDSETVKVPYEEMQASIGVLKRGDWIDLHGPSGSGKTVVMMDLAKHSLYERSEHILYIDFDQRTEPIMDDRFHLFHLKDTSSLSKLLERWLEEHVELDVLWMMIDNAGSIVCWDEIRALKDKWGFVLLTSTPIKSPLQQQVQYQFKQSINDVIQMELTSPVHKGPFAITLST
ncbi:hypothetical protein BY458DRAFT_545189 [Sporodiniella umbellata]|nr:hypothetical protein BY458DRAFT_545189 [Sporodiniella umbellata]